MKDPLQEEVALPAFGPRQKNPFTPDTGYSHISVHDNESSELGPGVTPRANYYDPNFVPENRPQ